MTLFEKIVKRLFDIFNSIIAILFFLFPWMVISIVIKIQSPGPIIYKAKRVGVNGKTFICYKFRTMRNDSGDIKITTLSNDNRVFGFGKFLRKTKLDETPQLFNILKGQMSVIGPRPEDKVNADFIFVGQYEKILTVKPGLSSPASLYDYTHGEKCVSEADYKTFFLPKKMKLELYYVNHQSLLYDLKILFRTIMVLLLALIGKKNFKEPKELTVDN